MMKQLMIRNRGIALFTALMLLCSVFFGATMAFADEGPDLTFSYTSEDATSTATVVFHTDNQTVSVNALAAVYQVEFETSYSSENGKLSLRELTSCTAKMPQELVDAGLGAFLPVELTAPVFYEIMEEDGGAAIKMLFGDPAKPEEAAVVADIQIDADSYAKIMASAQELKEVVTLISETEADGEEGTKSRNELHFFNNGAYTANGVLGGLYAWEGKGEWKFDNRSGIALSALKDVELNVLEEVATFADKLGLRKQYSASDVHFVSAKNDNGLTLEPLFSIRLAGIRLIYALSESLHPSRMDEQEIQSIWDRRNPPTYPSVGTFALGEGDMQKLGFFINDVEFVEPASMTLSKTAASLTEGNSLQLTTIFTPEDATPPKILFRSTNTAFATVDGSGLVEANTPGYTRIIAESEDGTLRAECEVMVVERKGIGIEDHTITLSGVLFLLSQGDNSIQFDAEGNVAIKGGATISSLPFVFDGQMSYGFVGDQLVVNNTTGTATDTSGFFALLTGSSSFPIPISATVTMREDGGADVNVFAHQDDNEIPIGAYSLSKEEVEQLKQASSQTETIAVTGVTLDMPALEIVMGQTATLTATVAPENATIKNVLWSSSAEGIATVDAYGKITALTEGEATITARTEDGGYEATCTVTVISVPVSGITLDQATLTLEPLAADWSNYATAMAALTATVSPENAGNQTVLWSSNDESVATVANGTVIGVAEGVATITARTEDGGFEATCTVTVKAPEAEGSDPVDEPDPQPSNDPITGTLTVNGLSFTHSDCPFAQMGALSVAYTVQDGNVTLGSGTASFFSEAGKAFYQVLGLDEATATAAATVSNATVTLTYSGGTVNAHISGMLTDTAIEYDAVAGSIDLSALDGSAVSVG